MIERVAGFVEGRIIRQYDGQVGVRHRHHIAFGAVDDRNRAAPVALARNAPVTQAEVHLALADRRVAAQLGFETLRHVVLGLIDGHAVEEARIDHAAVTIIGGVGDDERFRILVLGAHHRNVAETVLVDEVEIALVMRGAAEDGAGAVFHQHEVGDIDRQLPGGIERVDRTDAGVKALLLSGVDDFLRGADLLDLGNELGKFRILRRGGLRQRMIGRDRHEFCAEQRVRARRENLQLALAGRRRRRIEREADQQAFRPADPVALHQPHLVGPAVQRIQCRQQLLRVLRDLEDPLAHFPLFDNGTRTPAFAVDHLLVGEHGHVDGVPVHLALFALGEAFAQEVQKHLLLVLVVAGIAGRDLAAPVQRQPDRAELLLHRGDVVVSPGLRRDLALDGGVLGRQAEGVPAHRMQHVETLGAHEAGQHVAEGVIADMADMDAPRRVGEHLQHIVFRPRIVVLGDEDRLLVPGGLPARFGVAGVIAFGGHGIVGFSWVRPSKDGGLGHRSPQGVNGLPQFGNLRRCTA
ncbi:hypothetical protein ACVWW5_000116 [Bradyrhizobium sp. LM3.4]